MGTVVLIVGGVQFTVDRIPRNRRDDKPRAHNIAKHELTLLDSDIANNGTLTYVSIVLW